ncbi:Beta/Gamma crystallin [Lentzea aerocolonigenes]|nr:Beta/Gamma crystallin [Lentzea aerocolonigenes]
MVKKGILAGAGAVVAMLAALLQPPATASAVEVDCVDSNFVHVWWHPSGGPMYETCFAGAGRNWFRGAIGYSSWMQHLRTGNNDITFVDCNGTTQDFPRGSDISFSTDRCVAWINIKPY